MGLLELVLEFDPLSFDGLQLSLKALNLLVVLLLLNLCVGLI